MLFATEPFYRRIMRMHGGSGFTVSARLKYAVIQTMAMIAMRNLAANA